MNIHKQQKRILISTLRDPKVHGDDNIHSSQSQEEVSSFLDVEAEVHLPRLPRSRSGNSSLDAYYWQPRSTNDITNAIGDSDLRILRRAERRSPCNCTQTTLLEKEIDAILLQTATKNRAETVPNLYDVFES